MYKKGCFIKKQFANIVKSILKNKIILIANF